MKLRTLPESISYLYRPTMNGIKNGFGGSTEACENLYPNCKELPDSYRYPGIMQASETNHDEVRLLLDTINPIYEKWRRDNSTLHYILNV